MAGHFGWDRGADENRSYGSVSHTQQALGPDCVNGYAEMYKCAQNSVAIFLTIGLGYWSCFVLLAGMVALLRASGRGRTGWEAFGVVFVALVPIVWMPLLDQFHPQDLVALGLALGGTSCVLRRQWVWAGVLVGLAITSQQFALLVLVPLVVIAPGKQRWRLLISSGAVVALVSLPIIVATSGRAIHAVLFGTGDSMTYGGTLLWETGLRGSVLVFFARIVPILISVAVAVWASRRLGPRVFSEPTPLISLLAISLSLRLVFEERSLRVQILDSGSDARHARHRSRADLRPLGGVARPDIVGLEPDSGHALHQPAALGRPRRVRPSLICIVIVFALVVFDAMSHRVRWYLVAWLVVACCAFLQWPLWSFDSIRPALPLRFWQLILLPTGIAMAVIPLLESVRTAQTREPARLAEPVD